MSRIHHATSEYSSTVARLGTDMAPLALRIMDASAGADEQARYAQRLIAAGQRLLPRANAAAGVVIEGEVLTSRPLILPGPIAEPYREP